MRKTDKATILIIDDKMSNIYALEKLLEKHDRTFLSATNGNDGLKAALSKDIDLIILDVQMPEMDGFEVAQILRSNKRTKNIPIIFASAERKEHKSIIKGFEEGAIDYLFKPLDPEVTKAKVSVLLKIQLQKKELIEKNLLLEKSALLINNSADIIGIIDAVTLKFEDVNKAFTDILEYSEIEAKRVPVTFFLSDKDKVQVGELRDLELERLSFETQIYSKGRALKWLHWHVVVKYGKWFVNARDITEMKQVEKVRMYLSTVVKQSNDAVYIHDGEGNIISWNNGAEKIYGYNESEALEMKIWNIIPEYILPSTQEMVNKVMEGDKIQFLETKRITKYGKLVDVLFAASLITDPHDNIKSIAITERDITQQKAADEQVKQLNVDLERNLRQLELTNKELESFSYSVSHDLRAPLRSVGGYSKILEEDYSEKLDTEGKRTLGIIQQNVDRMNNLIDSLLEFSRLGKKEIHKAHIDMEKLVQDTINEFNNTVHYKASIKVNSLHPVKADPALITQVWINLISNAIKYSSKKENPEIKIGSQEKDGEIIFFIEDNGSGFNMDYVNKLFGVFQRLHKAEEFEGVGVGLALVQRIISRHGGRIWAVGKPNEGATFYFSLPA